MKSRIAALLLALCASISLAAGTEPKITLALVGGQVIDGYEGPPVSISRRSAGGPSFPFLRM